jgi:ATP-dependent exoDNAse (exonuclease V) alpha subunit
LKINKSTFGNKLTDKHLSFTNLKKQEINHYMMNKAVKEKKKAPLELAKLKYDKNSQNVRLLPKTPIIARINAKDYDIFNNEIFTIKKIDYDSEMILITDDVQTERQPIEIPIKEFQRLFYVAYCITVCRSQGSTYDHEYTLHEFERYDNRMKYVALSRATDIKHINIV